MAIIYYLEGGGTSLSSFVILWFNPLWFELLLLDKTFIITPKQEKNGSTDFLYCLFFRQKQ